MVQAEPGPAGGFLTRAEQAHGKGIEMDRDERQSIEQQNAIAEQPRIGAVAGATQPGTVRAAVHEVVDEPAELGREQSLREHSSVVQPPPRVYELLAAVPHARGRAGERAGASVGVAVQREVVVLVPPALPRVAVAGTVIKTENASGEAGDHHNATPAAAAPGSGQPRSAVLDQGGDFGDRPLRERAEPAEQQPENGPEGHAEPAREQPAAVLGGELVRRDETARVPGNAGLAPERHPPAGASRPAARQR